MILSPFPILLFLCISFPFYASPSLLVPLCVVLCIPLYYAALGVCRLRRATFLEGLFRPASLTAGSAICGTLLAKNA